MKFDPNATVIITKNRMAEVRGSEIRFFSLTPQGRGKKPRMPVTSKTPFEDAVRWCFQGNFPQIEKD